MMGPRNDRFVVLAAVDLDLGTSLVVQKALELCAHRDAEVQVVTILPPELPGEPAAPVPPPGEPSEARAALAFLTEIVEKVAREMRLDRLPRVSVHAVVGWVPDDILWLAAQFDVDLILVGTHGRRGLKRLAFGSVAEKVARLAACPVMVVRPKDHPGDGIPQVEPLCEECAAERARTSGGQPWCARHREHRVRAHSLHYAGSEDAPHAWSSSTGT